MKLLKILIVKWSTFDKRFSDTQAPAPGAPGRSHLHGYDINKNHKKNVKTIKGGKGSDKESYGPVKDHMELIRNCKIPIKS